MEEIVLIGGGGHCKVIIEAILAAKKYDIIGIIDSGNSTIRYLMGVPVIGGDNYLKRCFRKGVKFCFISVGSVGNPASRIRLYNKAKKIGFKFPNIIHPNAMISKFAVLGEGNYIAPGVIINTGAVIGNHCIINTGAIIEHDCRVGDFVHVAPGTKISGGVELKRYSHIGTGSSIREYLNIGENSIIGVGSVVVKDIGDNIVAYGNPCAKVRLNKYPVTNAKEKFKYK